MPTSPFAHSGEGGGVGCDLVRGAATDAINATGRNRTQQDATEPPASRVAGDVGFGLRRNGRNGRRKTQ